jgi:hypothetical protein
MKILFFLLLIPFYSQAQTIHVKDERIVYEGEVKMTGVAPSAIAEKMKKALPEIIQSYRVDQEGANSLRARGEFELTTPYHLIRTVKYTIDLKATDKGYQYKIDSVSFVEQERGKKATTRSSKDVLKDMGETGAIVGVTEKILNETDMKFQKMLAVLKYELGK